MVGVNPEKDCGCTDAGKGNLDLPNFGEVFYFL